MSATTLQERVMIQELTRSGLSDRRIAQQMGLGLSTVRKWRRKGQRYGTAGLVSQMGRPAKGFMSTFSQAIINPLRSWREAHPGWGPKTLRTELLQEAAFQGQRLPSQATITRWLKQEGRSRPYEKHQDLPCECLSPAQACHEEWEMDARGYERIPGVGVVALINLNDVFSRVKLMSYPCWLGAERVQRHPTTEDYQLVSRLAFLEWGLPDGLAVDRESIFYDNTSKSPFPTHFHLWLLALGVNLSFGRVHQPRDQAITERSHQTWQHQVLDGQAFPTQEALWQALQKRRAFLNEHLPCASLGERPPLVAHPEARLPRHPYRPEWEAELLDLKRVYAYLSQGRWFRKASKVGAVALGDQRYFLGKAWIKKEVEITFDPNDQHFVFQHPGLEPKRLPARGLTVQDLMGEMGSLLHLNALQLMLPFSWDEWRSLQLCQLLGDTTL
jgi:transposase